MTVQLILLKSGEELVADVREIIDKDTQKQMSLVFIKPVKITLAQQNVLVENSNETQNILNFEPWILTSKDEEFFVPHDWVVTVCEPTDDIKNSYIQNIGVKENDSQSDLIENTPDLNLGD